MKERNKVFCKEKRMLRQVDLRMVIGHVPPGYFRGMGNTGPLKILENFFRGMGNADPP